MGGGPNQRPRTHLLPQRPRLLRPNRLQAARTALHLLAPPRPRQTSRLPPPAPEERDPENSSSAASAQNYTGN